MNVAMKPGLRDRNINGANACYFDFGTFKRAAPGITVTTIIAFNE